MSSFEISDEEKQRQDHVAIDVQRQDHVAIDVTAENVLLINHIKEKMEDISTAVCISRVPNNLRQQSTKAYSPEEISIGPLHRGKPKSMDGHKWRYAFKLLSRKPTLEENLDACVKALKQLEHRARRCYKETIDLSSDDFVELMLIDGCFIIELLLRYAIKSLRQKGDPIFTIPGKLYNIRSNLMLLENQIPLFVIQGLFEVVPIPGQCNQSFLELAFRLFRKMIPGEQEIVRERFIQEGNHLLDLVHHCLLPSHARVQVKGEPLKRLAGAKKLKETGIKFKCTSLGSLLDIKLVHQRLAIPTLSINQGIETLLRNLIALEQTTSDDKQVTSYAFFMHNIMTSERDSNLLERKGILVDADGYETKVEELFSMLCDDGTLKDSYYNGIYESPPKARRRTRAWHAQRPKWKQLSTRTRLVSIVILLLAFTIVGTFFSVLAFFRHHY